MKNLWNTKIWWGLRKFGELIYTSVVGALVLGKILLKWGIVFTIFVVCAVPATNYLEKQARSLPDRINGTIWVVLIVIIALGGIKASYELGKEKLKENQEKEWAKGGYHED